MPSACQACGYTQDNSAKCEKCGQHANPTAAGMPRSESYNTEANTGSAASEQKEANVGLGGSGDHLNSNPEIVQSAETTESQCGFCLKGAIGRCSGCQKQFCQQHSGVQESGADYRAPQPHTENGVRSERQVAQDTEQDASQTNIQSSQTLCQQCVQESSKASKSRKIKFTILASAGLLVILLVGFLLAGKSGAIDRLENLVLHKGDFGVEGMAIRRQSPQYIEPYYSTGQSRLLAHISTDKPFYKANEIVFIEVFLADSLNKTPKFMPAVKQPIIEDSRQKGIPRYQPYVYIPKLQARAEILDSFGQNIFTCQTQNLEAGTIVFSDFKIPKDQAGGEFQIKVEFFDGVIPPSFRKFRIGTYSQPELFVTADFDQDTYIPGDQVLAKIKVRQPNGSKLPVGSSIGYRVATQGSPIEQSKIALNKQGETVIAFQIPTKFSMKVLSLSVSTYLGHSQEKEAAIPYISSHSVALRSDEFQVKFYPEMTSKRLVPDVRNKVYFQVLTAAGDGDVEHLDFVKAALTHDGAVIVDDILPVHNGRSFFEFVPGMKAEDAYQLRVHRTSDSVKEFAVPAADLKLSTQASLVGQGAGVYQNKPEEQVSFRIESNANFKRDAGRQLAVQIRNKDKIIHETLVNIKANGTQSSTLAIPVNDLYKQVPNGGVLIFKILDVLRKDCNALVDDQMKETCSKEEAAAAKEKVAITAKSNSASNSDKRYVDEVPSRPNEAIPTPGSADGAIDLERLIFLKPESQVSFEINSDSAAYSPGEQVELSVQMPQSLTSTVEEDEKFYASIVVTDTSSFLKLPKYKQMPSLPAMVYLEKEIKQEQIDEFRYSDQYVDQFFDVTQNSKDTTTQDVNLNLLLGIQDWRRYKLDDVEALDDEILGLEEGSDKRLLLEYLQGKKAQYRWQYQDVQMEAMAMDRAQPMAMRMEKQADFAAAGGAPPQPQMAQARAVPMMAPAADPAPSPPKRMEPEDNVIVAEGELSEDDFQHVKPGSRQYSHLLRKGYNKFSPRIDFTQTLMFQSAKELQDFGRKGLIFTSDFYLNDQVSQFVVTVNVYSNKGKYGFAKKTITSSKNTYSWFTLPTTLVAGDKLEIPITIFNNRQSAQRIAVEILESGDMLEVLNKQEQELIIGANSNWQITYPLNTDLSQTGKQRDLQVTLSVGGEDKDILRKKAKVIVDGFAQQQSIGDRIGAPKSGDTSGKVGREVSSIIKLPPTLIGDTAFRAVLYSTPLDSILDALQSLIRQPYGCFEQTSSTTYPMVMALKLIREFKKQYELKGDKAKLAEVTQMEAKILKWLKAGYEKLISFETDTKGYEWFGTSPGHEALTSYGLGQFVEMQLLTDFVDDSAITRNTDWLLSRRKGDGSGSFELNPKALDSFGRASQDITDVYIVWVLSSVKGYDLQNLKEEFKHVIEVSKKTSDPYLLSLCAGALFNVGETSAAAAIASRVAGMQDKLTGSVLGAESSITNSRGSNLVVETTSLALLSWLNIDSTQYGEQIDLAIAFILKQAKDGGRFGSTQATILSLQALVKYSQVFGGVRGSGDIVMYVNDQKVDSLAFSEVDQVGKVDFSNKINQLYQSYSETRKREDMKIELKVENYKYNSKGEGFHLSYLLQADYNDSLPPSADGALVEFSVSPDTPLSQLSKVGQIQTQKISLINKSTEQAQGMAVAIVSVPSCLTVELAQLELLKEGGSIDNFEISADNTLITLYWTYLKAGSTREVTLARTRTFAGQVCHERASQAYLYYDDDQRVWIK